MSIVRALPPVLAAIALAGAAAACELEPGGDPADGLEAEALARAVVPARELVITDPSVVRSPLETTFDPAHPSGVTPRGAWSFGRLIHNMLPAAERGSSAAASRLVMDWLRGWESDQSPNEAVSAARARPSIRLLVIEPWKAASGCAEPSSPATDAACVLDMARAPFELIAIFNRPDLRVIADDATAIGGEGRFVFQVVGPTLGVSATTGDVEVMDPTPRAQKFTVIFEYTLPVARSRDTLRWADRWHALGALPFGPGYNAALRAITNGFAGPDRDGRRPNGNAINQIRTNEVALMGARFPAAGFVTAKQFWELREFHLATTGLVPHTVNLEPARDFDIERPGQLAGEGTRTAELVAYLEASGDAVLAGRYRLPAGMSGNSALVGSAPYGAWGKLAAGSSHGFGSVPGPVRDAFALGTCAGCHRHETATGHFLHVTAAGAVDAPADRAALGLDAATPDDAIVLSSFLRGEIAPGGPRLADFIALLGTAPNDLSNHPGRRVCAGDPE